MPPNTLPAIQPDGKLRPELATYLMISMTKRCNMRCPGCYYLQQDKEFFKDHDLDLNQAKDIVEFYAEAGIPQIIPNAEGDVLLHPDYLEFVTHIESKKIRRKPWLVNNGIILSKVAKEILPYVGEVLISLDGSTAEKYNAYRGGNESLFNKVIESIKTVVKLSASMKSPPEIILNCVMTKDRIEDMPAMINLAEQLGVNTIKFTNYHEAGEYSSHEPLYRGNPKYAEIIKNLFIKNNYEVNIFMPALYGEVEPPFSCRMLASVMVGSNGDYAPCCRVAPDKKWGNYFESKDKHNNQDLTEFRKSVIKSKKIDDLPKVCRKCAHLSPRRVAFLKSKGEWVVVMQS